MSTFAKISEYSKDADLLMIYTNFQKLIDFVKNRGIFDENADFYTQEIEKVNVILSEFFSEKYDKKAKKAISKSFYDICRFLLKKHKLFSQYAVIYWLIAVDFVFFMLIFLVNISSFLLIFAFFYIFLHISIFLLYYLLKKHNRWIPI